MGQKLEVQGKLGRIAEEEATDKLHELVETSDITEPFKDGIRRALYNFEVLAKDELDSGKFVLIWPGGVSARSRQVDIQIKEVVFSRFSKV